MVKLCKISVTVTGYYLKVIILSLIRAPDCIVETIVISDESDAFVGVVLEAVVGLLQLVARIAVNAFWNSLISRWLVGFIISMK